MSKVKLFFIAALLGIWGALIYSNTFNATFHYDDNANIVTNINIHWDVLSWENFKKLFVWEFGRPFSFLTFALNYYFGGLDVRGFHYVNIGIHVFTATGLFLFIKRMLELPRFVNMCERNSFIAFTVASLWLSSPLQTQAVTYIVQRMAALAAMFYIYAFYFYLKGRLSFGRNRYFFYILTFISTLLAFGSKENSYTLPFYLLLFEIIIIRGWDMPFLLKKRVFFILSILVVIFAGALISLYYVPLETTSGTWFIYWLKTRFFTGMRVIVFYMTQLMFPFPSKLSLEHDFKLSMSPFDPPSTFLSIAFVSFLILSALMYTKKYPIFSFFTLWFFGNLAIETFNPYLFTVFEHRLYLPSMGFFAIVGVGLDNLFVSVKGKRVNWVLIGTIFVLVFFSLNTYIRNATWKDEYSLWSDVIRKGPNISVGYINLGAAYMRDGDQDEAVKNFLIAKSIAPRDPIVRHGLGIVFFNLKSYDKAIEEFSYLGSMGYISVLNEPSISYYFSRIAKNYYGHGRVKEALNLLDRAIFYDPNEPMLKDLKEKMEKRTITTEEIMQK